MIRKIVLPNYKHTHFVLVERQPSWQSLEFQVSKCNFVYPYLKCIRIWTYIQQYSWLFSKTVNYIKFLLFQCHCHPYFTNVLRKYEMQCFLFHSFKCISNQRGLHQYFTHSSVSPIKGVSIKFFSKTWSWTYIINYTLKKPVTICNVWYSRLKMNIMRFSIFICFLNHKWYRSV